MTLRAVPTLLFSLIASIAPMLAQTAPPPSVRIALPERTRLLQGQFVDLVLEVRNAAAVSGIKVTAGDVDLTSKFSAPGRSEVAESRPPRTLTWIRPTTSLAFQRPASEPLATLGTFIDQPRLDWMTGKAIKILPSTITGAVFILMVEAALIDKQSHPNQAAGQIWDTIEFDRAIGVARTWAARRSQRDTLIVVTADHDQSMSILGVTNSLDQEYFNHGKSEKITHNTAAGAQVHTVYGDSFSTVRAGLPFINSSTGASNNGGVAGKIAIRRHHGAAI